MKLLNDDEALALIGPSEIEDLTRAATERTFYGAALSEKEIAANRRIPLISTATCAEAARSVSQHFAAAMLDDRLAGFVIGTRHPEHGHELDWLMVHPDFHGTPVSAALMQAGMDWLGLDAPIWLSVIQFNHRAIRFYEKFGFAVDPETRTEHVVPHYIMRRPPGA